MPTSTDFLKAKDNATQKYEGARHLLNVTFPTVKDPKLLLGVIDNLVCSMEHSIEAILIYERLLRFVPVYSNDPKSQFNMFRQKSMHRNNISPEYVNLYLELKDILELHKKSPMAFQRGNKFVICNKDYMLKTLSINDIKDFLAQTKEFLDISEKVISKYGQENKNI